jgi:hypothetical protein
MRVKIKKTAITAGIKTLLDIDKFFCSSGEMLFLGL